MKTPLLRLTLLGLATSALLWSPAALAQDDDGDGVPNASDAYPCDANLAGMGFAPGEGAFGTLLFEDFWPQQGDLDFNDLVLSYNYRFELAPGGGTSRIVATYDVRALGGSTRLGLGLHLPAAAGTVSRVTRSVAGGPATDIALQAGDAEATFVVSSDLRELFGGANGPINSDPALNHQVGQRVVVVVEFATPTAVAMSGAPYDVYTFYSAEPSHEIHLPAYPGTSGMNTYYFGQADDGSSNGRFFIDFTGLPFALHIPQVAEFPDEYTPISSLYPNILGFAASGGTTNQNFYATNVQANFQYRDAQGNAAPASAGVTTPSADTSCLNPLLSGGWTSCLSFTNTAADDWTCNDAGWFDACVAAANAAPNQQVRLVLRNTSGTIVYDATGTKTRNWTQDNLTSSQSINLQYNRGSQHSFFIPLSTGHRLTISGRNAGNQGWGGSWGNGYGIVVQTAPAYAANNVVSVMTRQNSAPNYSPCRNRSLNGFTASHEIMYHPSGGIRTHSNASITADEAFLGTVDFLVR